MLVADNCQSLSTIPVSELIHYLTGTNQQAYLRLRLALGLNLRRQLLIAVCDNLAIRNALAEKLAHDLPRLTELSSFLAFELGISARLATPKPPEQLLTLTLHPTEPAILGPFFQELRRDPQKPKYGVQILGIEQLTRQPVHIQRAFLNHLRSLGRNFTQLDANMVLWVTRPWLRSIQQSAPEFWRWHNGIFEFEGDPLPASVTVAQPNITEKPIVALPVTPAAIPVASPQPAVSLPMPLGVAAVPVQPLQPQIQEEPEEELITAEDLVTAENLVVAEDLIAAEDLVPVAELMPEAAEELVPVFAAPVTVPNFDADLVADTLVTDAAAIDAVLANTATELAVGLPVEAVLEEIEYDDQPSHLEPTQEELELADLVLASVMQQVSQNPGMMLQDGEGANLEHPSLEPIRILQQVEVLQQAASEPDAFAGVYRQLGDFYRNHHETTLRENPELAAHQLHVGIKAYNVAWQFLPIQHHAIAEIYNDIGNLYWMLSRCPGAAERSLDHLQQGIDSYQQALDQMDCDGQPYTCAMLHNNLGAAYGDLAMRQEPVENLQKSIASYESAIQYRPAEAEPRRYAATQNNLGTAYWNLGQYQSLVQNLHRAVTAYSEALKIYNPEEEPLHYAMIQNNLGTAYWNLAQCDLDSSDPEEQLDASSEDFLRLAIGSYRVALIYRTAGAAPSAHAATQNNLGTAYWHLANLPSTHQDDVQGFLHQAITAYETAIETGNALLTPLTFDVAATYNNLASAYYQAATNRYAQVVRSTQASYLDLTLQHHLKAMELWGEASELYEAALNGVMQTIRAIHELQGIQGQTQALSKLPPNVLGTVMKAL
jgi:tetratricopeptide (TPR) repeat protein